MKLFGERLRAHNATKFIPQGAHTLVDSILKRVFRIETMINYNISKSLAVTLEFARSSSAAHVQKISQINEMIAEMEQLLASGKYESQRKEIEEALKRLDEERGAVRRSEQVANYDLSIEWKLVFGNSLAKERLGRQLAGDIDGLLDMYAKNSLSHREQMAYIQNIGDKVRAEIQNETQLGRKVFLEHIENLLDDNMEVLAVQSGIKIEKPRDSKIPKRSPTQEGDPSKPLLENLASRLSNIKNGVGRYSRLVLLGNDLCLELKIALDFADDTGNLIHDRSMRIGNLEQRLQSIYAQSNALKKGAISTVLETLRVKRMGLERTNLDDDQLSTLKISNRDPNMTPKDFEALRFSRIEKEWKIFLGKIQKLVSSNSEFAKRLSSTFLSAPLSESLPLKLLEIFPEVKVGDDLGKFLTIDTVPDQEITGKLSRTFRVKSNIEDLLDDLAGAQQFYPVKFQDILQNGYKHLGITKEELEILIRRYRFARDVKLLSTMESAGTLGQNANIGQYTKLENGIEYQISRSVNPTELANIFDSANWSSRTLIKDRVHKVVIGGKTYILKEWKSPKHTDHITGDKDAISSHSEFSMAEELYSKGPLHLSDISVTVERPVAFVKTPDGYSFVLFDEVKFSNTHFDWKSVKSHILNNRSAYNDEYSSLNDRLKMEGTQEISFEDFVEIKSSTLSQVMELIGDIYQKLHGFEHGDQGQFFYGLRDYGGRLEIELTMFDLEFSYKTSSSQRSLIDLTIFESWVQSSDISEAQKILLADTTKSMRGELGKLLQ